ncbi:MAG: hypothetical protein Kow0047_04980 [Anaerolineae bacterium]
MYKRGLVRTITVSVLVATLMLLILPAASVNACAPVYHRVRAGETLTIIAARYGVSVWSIAQANGISNINRIYIGQVLRIPTCYAPPYGGFVHIVQPGETLGLIAARYGVSVWELARVNGIWNTNYIYVGQRLIIPGYAPPGPPPYPPYPPYPPAPPAPPPPPPPPPPACSITPVLGFGQVWNNYPGVRTALGCPTATEYGTDATQQRFQQGVVIWAAGQDQFWVLWNNRTWGRYAASQWYDVAWQLGWPTDAGAIVRLSVQDFEHGHMLWSSTLGIYVLYDNGTWQYFN